MTILEYLRSPELLPMVQDALIAGIAVVVMCGVLSPIVVVKRLGFVGQGISHSAFGGIGIASILIALGIIPQGTRYGAVMEFGVIVISCIAAALIIAWLSRVRQHGTVGKGSYKPGSETPNSTSVGNTQVGSEDTAIGLVLVGAMAMGALLVQLSTPIARQMGVSFTPKGWESILFGSLMMAGRQEVWVSSTLCITLLAGVWLLRRSMLFFVFDEDSAQAFGVPTGWMRTSLMVLLAVCVVTAMKAAGVVLATALLVLPGAIALRFSDRLRIVMSLSIIMGVLGLVIGLAAALEFNVQVGPAIVLTLTALYVFASLRRVLPG